MERIEGETTEQFRDMSTWLGKPPPLADIDLPLDYKPPAAPPDFLRFNNDPELVVNEFSPHFSELLDHFTLCPFLFQPPGLHPRAIHHFIFAHPENRPSLLYFFFGSANLEFLSIAQAASILFSRIAFSDDPAEFALKLQVFSEVYLRTNQWTTLSLTEIQYVARACIAYSFHRKTDSEITQQDFSSVWLSKVKASNEHKTKLFEEARQSPIPLFFMFAPSTEAPLLGRTGSLSKLGGGFKRKSNRYFTIDDFTLKCFKDPAKTQIAAEVELRGTVTKVIAPTSKKEIDRLVITRKDDKPFGFKFTKGQKKKASHTQYVFYGGERPFLLNWANSLNFNAFMAMIADFGQPA
jgi:hypothetical protein